MVVTDFFFTTGNRKKFPIKFMHYFPPYLTHNVAALPLEKFVNLTNFIMDMNFFMNVRITSRLCLKVNKR